MKVSFLDTADKLKKDLAGFYLSGATLVSDLRVDDETTIPVFTNEFWTRKQRDAHSLHEVSYRACFKPQLPRFFIERLTKKGDVVFDPFLGRGTTVVEAAFLGRVGQGADVNPLSEVLIMPRLNPPSPDDVEMRLNELELDWRGELSDDLLVFYHEDTLRALCAMRDYFKCRREEGTLDEVDQWIQMVATSRLTGHSAGFFSVYTLPPNQAVSVKSQIKINAKREQVPEFRDVRKLILKKSKSLLRDLKRDVEANVLNHRLFNESADQLQSVEDESVSLVVTSPPFLDIVDYKGDNWLRCWFNSIDAEKVPIWGFRKLDDWAAAMTRCFKTLHRITKPGGWIAFEVGEIRKGSLPLDDTVALCGKAAGLKPEMVLINAQDFTKTAQLWGVDNVSKGTNTNRIVVFRKMH